MLRKTSRSLSKVSFAEWLIAFLCLLQAVYHMPTEENLDHKESIPLALQSLFYKVRAIH